MNQSMYGLRDGFQPTVGDAMVLFDESRAQTEQSTVIKCWLKSQSLPQSHVDRVRAVLSGLSNDDDIYLNSGPISYSEAQHIAQDLNAVQTLSIPTTPLPEILQEVDMTIHASQIATVLNSSAPFDIDATREEVSKSMLQELFDGHRVV